MAGVFRCHNVWHSSVHSSENGWYAMTWETLTTEEVKRRGVWSKLSTDQKIHLIKAVWREGIFAKQIGDAVGASKGSIIGVYFRNRDALDNYPLMKSYRDKHRDGEIAESTRVRHERANRVAEEEETEEIYVPRAPTLRIKAVGVPDTGYGAALNVTLFENAGCMWPVNDGGPYLFCGHVKFKGSYCQYHHEASMGRGTEGERRAHKIGERHVAN